jgi:hypothetical protein
MRRQTSKKVIELRGRGGEPESSGGPARIFSYAEWKKRTAEEQRGQALATGEPRHEKLLRILNFVLEETTTDDQLSIILEAAEGRCVWT